LTATISSSKNRSLIPLFTTGRYFKEKYGVKVYKIPVSISGFTCPNIDGKVAKGGCIYCENRSFSPNLKSNNFDFLLNPDSKNPLLEQQLKELSTQIEKSKIKLSNKFGAQKFIVYFQSFTNTYAPLQTLIKLYERALLHDDVIGLSIGTRSDSISSEILDFLEEKSKDYEIWLEIGVQSIHDETLKIINRGHDFNSVQKSISKIKKRGLKVCVHLIFGLPKENEEMILKSIKKSVALEIDALKIHPLYITKNSALARWYANGIYEPLDKDSYLNLLAKALLLTPRHIIIQRLMAGEDSENLIAPLWCKDYRSQKSSLAKKLKEIGFIY